MDLGSDSPVLRRGQRKSYDVFVVYMSGFLSYFSLIIFTT
jgi:hypothetical protein